MAAIRHERLTRHRTIHHHPIGPPHGHGIHIKPSHKGLLHKNLGVPAGKNISTSALAKAAKSSSPAVRKRAVFAQNARKWAKAKR